MEPDMCHKAKLRAKFDDGDAATIVAMQIDDGPLTVMAAHPLEVAQFALILIDEARAHGSHPADQHAVAYQFDTSNKSVAVEVRVNHAAVGSHQLPGSLLEPGVGETMVPFLTRVVQNLLTLYRAPHALPA
jgi:hypothetical protein